MCSTPPPPQLWSVGQAPQSIWPSQPSPITPQYRLPPTVQLFLLQLVLPHKFGVPPAPHAEPWGQSPQSTFPPQPLPTMPQYCPPLASTQTVGVQSPEFVGAPQTLEAPPPPQ